MHNGHHRLAHQRSERGYFADVSLAVKVEPGPPGLNVLFDDDAGLLWRTGASFGIAYALEKAPQRQQRVTVRVKRLHGMIVDTTEILVAYASAFAVWDALGVTPARLPAIDIDTGTVSFPK